MRLYRKFVLAQLFLIVAHLSWAAQLEQAPSGSTKQTIPPPAANATSSRAQQFPTIVFANERLEIPPIRHKLKVAEANEIPIVLHTSYIPEISSMQSVSRGEISNMVHGGEQQLTVFHHEDGSAFVKVVPLRLGKIQLSFVAFFPDRAVAQRAIIVEVEPSTVQPAALSMESGALEFPWLYFDLTEPQHPTYLEPVAYYFGLQYPVRLDPAYVSFKVNTENGAPVIRLDETTGRITPLRPGDALVETHYAGLIQRSCIQVRDSPYSGDISNCKQLRHLDRISASAPLNTSWSNDPGGIVSSFYGGDEFFTDRLAVTVPDKPVALAQPVLIPLKLSENKIADVGFTQWRYNGYGVGVPSVVEDTNGRNLGGGSATLVTDKEKHQAIEIVPLALGELEVGIAVRYADHGFAQRFFLLKVVPSAKGLKKIQAWDDPADIHRPQFRQLSLDLTYAGIRGAIRLHDLDGIKMKVEQPENAPVIQIDRHGLFQELHPGKALVYLEVDGIHYCYAVCVRTVPRSYGKPQPNR